MNQTSKKLLNSTLWLIGTIAFFSLGLEFFLTQIGEYDVYRVLNISFSDLLILILILIPQYLLLKRIFKHIDTIWQATKYFKHQKLSLLGIALFSCLIYALLPSQFPFWILLVLLSSLCIFHVFLDYFITSTFLKITFLLLFGAAMNSSLIFWMHEESNIGRHIRYAKQLAEKQDTIAENIITTLVNEDKDAVNLTDKFDFWEKKWVSQPYLTANYKMSIKENRADSLRPFYTPILTFNKAEKPIYKVFFPENYTLELRLNTDFRKSVYSTRQSFKKLKGLDNFQFLVVDKSKIILANSNAFVPYILDFELPEIGKGEKIELRGFDVLAYRHSDEIFVLIGEPLSEIQVWISNFAFFFSLLLFVIILVESIGVLLLNKKPFHYWQELPIQFRIQIVLIGITCLLFFIIAATTFIFLDQNNEMFSSKRQIHISETLQEEILQEKERHDWRLEDFEVPFLAALADKNQCDIDLYRRDGSLVVSSFATAQNIPYSVKVKKEIIQQITQNHSLILTENLQAKQNKEPYLRTYFGIIQNDKLEGIASISSFKSEIGTSPYIPIVMMKLLNVYVFLLLITWSGGLLLINLLTKPLELLAVRLSNFKLGEQNEKLKWKGDDAIGQLILEYNKMVDKVEVTTQELIRSEREGAWQVMAQQIAHEVNNKLTPLRLNTQFLTRIVSGLDARESEMIQRITNGLVQEMDGLSRIATQFKLFAKLDTPEIKSIDLKQFIKQFLEEYKKKEGIQYLIKTDLEKQKNPIVNVDTQHLQEVLNNIISNAENSIPEEKNGVISLGIKTESEHVIIEVEDNGSGIDSSIIKNIFDPKFSVDSSQTGLGLPICKRIIEFYNGKLSFDTAEGEGTSVFISFTSA